MQERGFIQPRGLAGSGNVVQLNALVLEPVAIGPLRGKLRFNFVIWHNAALLEIHEEQATRLQAALRAHVRRIHRDHTHFAGHDHAIIMRFIIAAWPQTVPVQHSTNVFAVGKGNRRRAIPRLHDAGVVLVKVALGLRHVFVLLPCLGNHQQHSLLQRAAAHQPTLQRVIEVPGIRAFRLHDRI